MLHPGKEIMMRLDALSITQKDFSQKIWKRVSEINELIKGKRNITMTWEFILSDFFKTPAKYRIYKQVDYDYEQMLSEQELKRSFELKSSKFWTSEEKVESIHKYQSENVRKIDTVSLEEITKEVSWWNDNQELQKKQPVEKTPIQIQQEQERDLSIQEDVFKIF